MNRKYLTIYSYGYVRGETMRYWIWVADKAKKVVIQLHLKLCNQCRTVMWLVECLRTVMIFFLKGMPLLPLYCMHCSDKKALKGRHSRKDEFCWIITGSSFLFQLCIVEHFHSNPLSVLCCQLEEAKRRVNSLSHNQCENVRRLPSFRR